VTAAPFFGSGCHIQRLAKAVDVTCTPFPDHPEGARPSIPL
jgi:hypothetical protein